MAEVIKYGCIADEELLTRLEQQEPDWPWIIRRCLACKAALVAQDERDEGPRRLLNFGHTFGHAMEALGGTLYPRRVRGGWYDGDAPLADGPRQRPDRHAGPAGSAAGAL